MPSVIGVPVLCYLVKAWWLLHCSQSSIFLCFYLIVEHADRVTNWMPAQNRRLDWVGSGTEESRGAVDILGKSEFPVSPEIEQDILPSQCLIPPR